MVIVVMDDELLVMENLKKKICEAVPESLVQGFRNQAELMTFAQSIHVDVAFLDIRMGPVNGLEVAKRLKEIGKTTNIVFVTGFSQYALDAFNLFASGYILKPADVEDIERVMENLRSPVTRKEEIGVNVRTFGNFEVYVDGVPIHFSRSKAKEMFAYLIHKKGTSCTVKELASVLFEEKAYNFSLQRQIQTIRSSMFRTLREAGCEAVIKKQYNSLSIDVSRINCDYYRFLKWDAEAVNSYTGEYMANYSWGEFTIGYLDSQIN